MDTEITNFDLPDPNYVPDYITLLTDLARYIKQYRQDIKDGKIKPTWGIVQIAPRSYFSMEEDHGHNIHQKPHVP